MPDQSEMERHILDDASRAQVQSALRSALDSALFAEARRLRDFLSYIVTEALAGRQDNIRAKTIAIDVYGRDPSLGPDQEGIVRVDAGRLRRRLAQYYLTEGENDPVRILIPPGGYVPVFEQHAASVSAGAVRSRSVFWPAAIVAGVVAVIAAVWWSAAPKPATTAGSPEIDETTQELRRAVHSASPASFQARALAAEAEALIFPPLDFARVKAASALCERATELAPKQREGYSCAAHAWSFQAYLMPVGERRAQAAQMGASYASRALEIAPSDARSHLAKAWAEFVLGQTEPALQAASRAMELDQGDPFVRNFYGMMNVLNGAGAQLVSGFPEMREVSSEVFHPFIVAGALLQMDEYADCIEFIEYAIEREGRTSALMNSLRIAANEALGRQSEAERLVHAMKTSWPGWNHEETLSQLFVHEKDARQIADQVSAVMRRLNVSGQ